MNFRTATDQIAASLGLTEGEARQAIAAVCRGWKAPAVFYGKGRSRNG